MENNNTDTNFEISKELINYYYDEGERRQSIKDEIQRQKDEEKRKKKNKENIITGGLKAAIAFSILYYTYNTLF